MLGTKPLDSPVDPNTTLMPDKRELFDDPETYCTLVGKLNYLTITRPGISFVASVVSLYPLFGQVIGMQLFGY